jgi:hypothetical protein
MRARGGTRSDLALLRVRLKESIAALGLARQPTPEYERSFQIDESLLQDALDADVGYANPRALEYDINSVRSIYTLRRGKAPFRLDDAVAVLVTSNAAFARVAYEYGKQHESTREVASVITDFSLANVAWLKAPVGAPRLPARELMAMCYAALEPGPGLWSAYMREIDKLRQRGDITARDHELLRSSLRVRDELANLTMGEEAALTGRTVMEILHRIEASIVAEKASELAVEQAAHADTKSQREDLTREKEEVIRQVYWATQSTARWISRTVLGVGCVALAVGGVCSPYLTSRFVKSSFALTALVNAVVAAAGVWGLLGGVFGWSLREKTNALESAIQRRLQERALKALRLSPPSRVDAREAA